MTAKPTPGRRSKVRPPQKQVPAIFREAFVHALQDAQYSEARAARSMGVDRSTVERYVSGETDVNAKNVMESDALWRPFWGCVGKLMHKARGGGSKRKAPRIARARGNRG